MQKPCRLRVFERYKIATSTAFSQGTTQKESTVYLVSIPGKSMFVQENKSCSAASDGDFS